MKIKVAIADDHPLVRKGLELILANCDDIEITGSYNNGKELLGGIALLRPHVLVLDIQMPEMTGDEAAEIINREFPDIKMIALTNLDNIFYIKNMMRKGVLGYILKTTREEILPDAIRTVFRGEIYLEPMLKDKVLRDAVQTSKENPEIPILSRREKEIMKHIASNLTSQQIADILFISKRTVDNQRNSLMIKFGVKNVAALVKKAMQLGFI